ncbi:SusD/RagB family nutrient-binding outer membrane lipoprotein [Puia sp.]|uniref:SusD/RagB family nutrient-binding outer membrane lipoprotein n=1 Tax=Puia sp. TaxID=2045100 RepID=UPI002F426EB4
MKKLLIIAAPVLLALPACKKDLSAYNTNNKAASTVPAASLFLAGEKNLSDYYEQPSGSYNVFRQFAQSWTGSTYTTEARYVLSAYNSPNNWWLQLYTSVLNNLGNAKALFPVSVTDPATLRNDLIVTDILEVYTYNLLVSTYGNIPYSKAENRLVPFPAYDDAKTVYMDLLTRLDSCIANINTGAPSLGKSDQIYAGNTAAWKKFAATLKLKMAMVLADTDPATASKKVQEAVSAGVFTSNADNARFVYQTTPTGNTNPVWQALVNSGRHDFVPANLMLNTLKNWNDPRLPLYFTKASDSTYKGGVPGGGNSVGSLSTFSAQWSGTTWPTDMLDYAETEFLLAEATERGFITGASAEQHYNNGITASIQYWGGTTTQAQTYLAQTAVAYTTATGDYKQKIAWQEWIAMADRGWDAWTLIRRLKQPNIDAISAPLGAASHLPMRFYYPPTEQTANPTNWAAAVKAMGGTDDVNTKLFWIP